MASLSSRIAKIFNNRSPLTLPKNETKIYNFGPTQVR